MPNFQEYLQFDQKDVKLTEKSQTLKKEDKLEVFKVIQELYGTEAALEAVTNKVVTTKREADSSLLNAEKKPKVEDPAPIEDYYQPKLNAMGGPVLAKAVKQGKGKQLSGKGMKPLSEYWGPLKGV